MPLGNERIWLDKFCFRQFDDDKYNGTKISMDKQEFMAKVMSLYDEKVEMEKEFKDRPALVDGYAPFCKHIFLPNFDDSILQGEVEIDDHNAHLLKSDYEARNEKELPVLTRYFRKQDIQVPKAKFLDLILYSREQCIKEAQAMGNTLQLESAPWRLIAVKGQGVPYETPMTPITCMRNELISQGGSGVPIEREKYMEAVKYWKAHATVR